MDREQLYQRIDARVDAMLNAGLLDEVRRLLDDGYSPDLKSMQSIGYRHMINFLHGRMNWEEAVRTLKRDTRRYAKRQLTWFKAVPDIVWLSPQDIRRAEALIRRFFV
jgi:tRNA dimethylallyltransferase